MTSGLPGGEELRRERRSRERTMLEMVYRSPPGGTRSLRRATRVGNGVPLLAWLSQELEKVDPETQKRVGLNGSR